MSSQGTEWQRFIEAELRAEMDRRTELDRRAQSVISSGSALTVFVGSLSALAGVAPADLTELPTCAVWLFFGAAAAFGLAAASGLLAMHLFEYSVVTVASARAAIIGVPWRWSESRVRNVVLQKALETIGTLRVGNNKKATRILVANYLQLAAMLQIGVALVVIIKSR